mgnify:FL=1|jgi:hypothetical protein
MSLKKICRLTATTALLSLLTGCTYVQLTEAGSQVRQASAADVSTCQMVGSVSSQTKDKVVVDRNSGKVREELIVLARNRAADLGANALVEDGAAADGVQNFKAYRCQD